MAANRRTTIVLPAALRAQAKRRAKERGESFASLLRRALERELAAEPHGRDPIFQVTLYPEIRRRDGSANHDLLPGD